MRKWIVIKFRYFAALEAQNKNFVVPITLTLSRYQVQEGSYLFILEVLFAGDGRSVADVTEGCAGGVRRSARLDSGARQHLVLLHRTAQQV